MLVALTDSVSEKQARRLSLCTGIVSERRGQRLVGSYSGQLTPGQCAERLQSIHLSVHIHMHTPHSETLGKTIPSLTLYSQ